MIDLPAQALASLEAREWRRGTPHERAALQALLDRHGFTASEAVLGFEAAYGGLEITERGASLDDDYLWIVGAGACLASEAHGCEGGTMVPVAYSPNDIIFSIDEHGAGWVEDTIEGGGAVKIASNGRLLLARLLLHDDLFAMERRELAGAHGEAEGLPFLPDLSDELERWWGDAARYAIERVTDDGVVTIVADAVS
jgi:hypothetical protein